MYLTLRALPSCLEGFEVGAKIHLFPSLTDLKKIYEQGASVLELLTACQDLGHRFLIRCVLAVLLPAITTNLRSRSNLPIIALESIVNIFVIDDTYN